MQFVRTTVKKGQMPSQQSADSFFVAVIVGFKHLQKGKVMRKMSTEQLLNHHELANKLAYFNLSNQQLCMRLFKLLYLLMEPRAAHSNDHSPFISAQQKSHTYALEEREKEEHHYKSRKQLTQKF